jgi:hypothetical protein
VTAPVWDSGGPASNMLLLVAERIFGRCYETTGSQADEGLAAVRRFSFAFFAREQAIGRSCRDETQP